MGYTYASDNDGTDLTITHPHPEPLLRYGILVGGPSWGHGG
jgi:hypothetical protein